jgi:hypothetical protein
MNLQIVDTNVEFGFPLQATGTTPVKGELIKPISDKIQYKVEVSYTITAAQPSQPQQ